MTTQEAIKWLREAEILDLCSGNTKDREAVNMAVAALEEQELNCDGCVYQEVADRFVPPCFRCKRNCIDYWKGESDDER